MSGFNAVKKEENQIDEKDEPDVNIPDVAPTSLFASIEAEVDAAGRSTP